MSFPAYPEYKDSEVEWLGKVPEGWDVVAYKRLVDIQNGADHKDVQQDEGYPVYGSGGVFTYASRYLFDGEAVLLGRKGTVDKPMYVNEAFWTVDTMYWAMIRDGVHGRFAYYAATNIPFGYYATRTALPSMTQRALGDHRVPRPPLSEQRAIAVFLDRETAKIDAAVAAQERLIALLAEKRAATISHAVTKGLDAQAPMKDSGIEWLGQIPAHWEISRVANVFAEVVEASDDTRPVLSVSIHDGVSDDEIDEDDRPRMIVRSEDRSKYKAVEPGDLVYNMMRAWQGGFGAVKVSGAVSPAYVVARPTAPNWAEYANLTLRTPQAVTELKRYSRGVTDFRLRLYWDEFKNIVIPKPPSEEVASILEQIQSVVTDLGELEARMIAAIELLRERRAALISAAVTGKIDVRGEVELRELEAA